MQDENKYPEIRKVGTAQTNPIFEMIPGDVESREITWENKFGDTQCLLSGTDCCSPSDSAQVR
jgi:hypothetical protein